MAIRFLLKHLPTAAFVVHAEGGLLDVNAGFSEIIGCKTDELVGRSLYNFMDEEMVLRLKTLFSQPNLLRAIKYDIKISSV